MTQAALQLQAAGFELALMGDGGLVVSPKSRLTDDTRQFIKAHKQELVEYLSRHAVNDANDWQQADRAYQAHHIVVSSEVSARITEVTGLNLAG